MLLRFDITITQTTKTCPTAVSFSLYTSRMKHTKHVWHNSNVSTPASRKCLNAVAFWHYNYRNNEDLPKRGLGFAQPVQWKPKTRLASFHLRCISNVSTRQFFRRSTNSIFIKWGFHTFPWFSWLSELLRKPCLTCLHCLALLASPALSQVSDLPGSSKGHQSSPVNSTF